LSTLAQRVERYRSTAGGGGAISMTGHVDGDVPELRFGDGFLV
jgi:hypothetical protein